MFARPEMLWVSLPLPGTRSSRDLCTDEVLSKQFAHITCSSGTDAYDGCEPEVVRVEKPGMECP